VNGFVYTAKAKQLLVANQNFLGVGGWLHHVQGKYPIRALLAIARVSPGFSH
jgi:hypothetical protein